MQIVIAGASGLLGTALTGALADRGDRVVHLVRREPCGGDESRWDPSAGRINPEVIAAADVVVNLSGAGIADRPWTASYRRELVTSRLRSARTLADALRSTGGGSDRRIFLSASAIGYYGAHRGDEILAEGADPGDDFLARLCAQWESIALTSGVQTIFLRTASVLTNRGGFIGKQRLLYRAGLGGPIGSGEQWLSWITLDDHVRAMLWAADGRIPGSGPLNLSAPEPVRNREFSAAYAKSLGRPSLMPFPRLPVAAVMGREMVDSTIMAGQRVVPAALERSGFCFSHPNLASALRWMATEG